MYISTVEFFKQKKNIDIHLSINLNISCHVWWYIIQLWIDIWDQNEEYLNTNKLHWF